MENKLAGNFIVIKKVVRAPREAVYEAWVNPEIRKQWWKTAAEYDCGLCEIDNRIGGQYRIGMVKGDTEHVCFGEFTELNPPESLSFSWSWEHAPEFAAGSVVEVQFFEIDLEGTNATEVVLTHHNLGLPVARSEHNQGWVGCLSSLGSYFDENDKPSCEE